MTFYMFMYNLLIICFKSYQIKINK